MAQISGDWLPAVRAEFAKPYYRELYNFVRREYADRTVYPPADQIFNALHLTPLGKVKAVILGQDPYHGEGQAHGMCFSVRPGCPPPPSLVNIFRELHDDLGCYEPDNGYLLKWAKQGVLLLNTVLTVRAHEANSHRGRGWEQFTDAVLRAVSDQDRPVVYMLWGSPAQAKASLVHNSRHLILRAPHPSPLSAYRGFSVAGISANAMPSWKKTACPRSTGRSIICPESRESLLIPRRLQKAPFPGVLSVAVDEIRIRVYNNLMIESKCFHLCGHLTSVHVKTGGHDWKYE